MPMRRDGGRFIGLLSTSSMRVCAQRVMACEAKSMRIQIEGGERRDVCNAMFGECVETGEADGDEDC